MLRTLFSTILLRNITQLYAEIIEATQLEAKIKQERLQTCLDIGTGNGISAHMLEEKTGLQIQGLDIGDFRWQDYTSIPVTVYDGKTYPFTDKSFDISLIAFVLHHSDDHSLLLQEANRVTKRYVILLEELVSNPFHKLLMIVYDKCINLVIFQKFISTPHFHSETELDSLIKDCRLKIEQKYFFKSKGFVQRVCYLLSSSDLASK